MVSRQVVTGSGQVGIGASGDEPGFQLSQRADYIGSRSASDDAQRGIINTRDEPHADADKYHGCTSSSATPTWPRPRPI